MYTSFTTSLHPVVYGQLGLKDLATVATERMDVQQPAPPNECVSRAQGTHWQLPEQYTQSEQSV